MAHNYASMGQARRRCYLYMKANVGDHVDHTCDVVNCTSLAEASADALTLYDSGPDFPIPNWVYDLAVEVAESEGWNE